MSKFNFDTVLKNIEQTKRELPKKLANMTQNYFVLSWKKQGFDNKDWKEVKRRIPGTPEFKYPMKKGLSRRTKPIGVQSGELRRRVANSVIVADWDRIKLLVDLPYAEAFNGGTEHQAARPFMGQTDDLTGKQTKMIEQHFNTAWGTK